MSLHNIHSSLHPTATPSILHIATLNQRATASILTTPREPRTATSRHQKPNAATLNRDPEISEMKIPDIYPPRTRHMRPPLVLATSATTAAPLRRRWAFCGGIQR